MHNSSSKIYQEEDEYYLMREIAIKRKQIENKQKELMLLRKKQYDREESTYEEKEYILINQYKLQLTPI